MVTRRSLLQGGLAAVALSRVSRADPRLPGPGLRRTVHFTTSQLKDPILGPGDSAGTFSLSMRLEDEPVALRVGFANDIALDYKITAVAARVSDAYGDGVNPSGAAQWSLLTANGSGADQGESLRPPGTERSLTVPGNGGGPRVPRLTWTDWTPITSVPPADGSGRPILFLRASAPAWSYPRCCETADDFAGSPAARGRDMIARIHLGQDLATRPDRIDGFGRWSASPFYCVQYMGKRPGATVLWGGDSHFAGDTTLAGIDAFPLQSCLELSRPERPVAAANYAWGGSPSLIFLPILEKMLTVCRPQFLVLQGWTANDGPTAAAAEAYVAKVRDLAGKARALGAYPILVTRFSRETLAQNAEELAEADRLRRQELAWAAADLTVIDATAVLDDPHRPGAYRAGFSSDTIHPNTAGHAAVAALLTPALDRLLTAAGH